MASHCTLPSTLLAAATDEVIREWNPIDFDRLLQRCLDQHHRSARERCVVRCIEWRMDIVHDVCQDRAVPMVCERLVRWDYREPSVIFRSGFEPRRTIRETAMDVIGQYVDIERYVSADVPSIFVSTARYFISNGVPTYHVHHEPPANTYRYEIHAPGGLEVNLLLESIPKPVTSDEARAQKYWHEQEIAFPGGIRPQFIRAAWQHDADGREVCLWLNTDFNIDAYTGDGTFPSDLPPITHPVQRHWRHDET